jgi:hypothetical protein
MELEIKRFSKRVAWVEWEGKGGADFPCRQQSRDWKLAENEYLNEKCGFLGLKIFKLLNQTKENSKNDCAFFKFLLLLGVAIFIKCPKRQKTWLHHWAYVSVLVMFVISMSIYNFRVWFPECTIKSNKHKNR